MPEVAVPRFACDGCGKKYPWKPELTNKKAKCKCGAVITVPDLSAPADDGPPALPDEGIFDIIDNAPEIASPKVEAFRAAVAVPVAAPSTKKSGAKSSGKTGAKAGGAGVLPYRSGPTQRQRDRDRERMGAIHDMKRDVYIPAGLVVGSFLAYMGWIAFHGGAGASSLAVYSLVMMFAFAAKTVCMIVGAFIIAGLAGVSFGPFWTAILKLAAVATAPDILATIIEDAIGVPGAGLMASSISLAFYWILVSQLFGMDANEAWVVVVLFGVLRWILTFVLGMILIGLLVSGSSIGASAVSGAAGAASVSATSEAAEFDEKVASWKEDDDLVEAVDYIQTKGRQSAMIDWVKSFYAAGAKNVWFATARDINGKTEPVAVVLEWPKDSKKRAAVLKAIHDWQNERAKLFHQAHPDWEKPTVTLLTDEGGRYTEVPMAGG